jgi:hypothetical protein
MIEKTLYPERSVAPDSTNFKQFTGPSCPRNANTGPGLCCDDALEEELLLDIAESASFSQKGNSNLRGKK